MSEGGGMKDSPKMSSPLIRFKQSQIDEEDESEEDDSKSRYYSNALSKVRRGTGRGPLARLCVHCRVL